MVREATIRRRHKEPHKNTSRLRDFILGWQDGLVNVLGITLAVAVATGDVAIIIIAGMAATFAESISMAAVAYTSFKAEADFYESELRREKWEMKNMPDEERREISVIYRGMGFKEPLLGKIVRHITKDKKRWLKVMMEHELKMFPPKISPVNTAIVVGISAIIGSLIPIAPFFLVPTFITINDAILTSLVISTIVLFFVGAYTAVTTIGDPIKGGIKMAVIGMVAAIIGFAIGAALGATVV